MDFELKVGGQIVYFLADCLILLLLRFDAGVSVTGTSSISESGSVGTETLTTVLGRSVNFSEK